ncbi:twin-arginine translocation signal domain-containing protein [Algibacter lectus]|uniref:Twin-arginine translocation signal domain-containing protein n=1 Tax=Algibacter lectus TaxID=221126 RepID=A0A090V738_9FLAO|nr:hypothetical protein JCM19300_3579 [Algibacter lectus]
MKNETNKRRDFLKKSAMVGLAAPHLAFASTNTETANTTSSKRPKVLFFDVNETLLDLTAMKESVGKVLGNRQIYYRFGLQPCYNIL